MGAQNLSRGGFAIAGILINFLSLTSWDKLGGKLFPPAPDQPLGATRGRVMILAPLSTQGRCGHCGVSCELGILGIHCKAEKV